MSERWFRVYTGLVDDPKVQRLPAERFRALINLWCLAASNDGVLPPLEDIAFKLRISVEKAGGILEGLHIDGLLENEGTVWTPHNWNGRQFKSDVSTVRVKQHRQRKRNVSPAVSETPPEAETETDTEAAQQTVSEIEPPPDEGIPSFLRRDVDQSEADRITDELDAAAGERAPNDLDISPILALIAKGYDLAGDILPVVRERAAKAQKRISSWRYFVPAIQEARASNGAIKPKENGTPSQPQTWVPRESPMWVAAAARYRAERGKDLLAIGSHHGTGVGAFVPKAWLEERSAA